VKAGGGQYVLVPAACCRRNTTTHTTTTPGEGYRMMQCGREAAVRRGKGAVAAIEGAVRHLKIGTLCCA